MATDSIIATQQPANSTSQLIYSPNDKAAANNATDMKNDSDLEKLSRNSTSCDEESTDELGRLVIDLENDNDADKLNKDMILSVGSRNHSDGRNTPVRNNNNNNNAITNTSCSNKYGHNSTASKTSGIGSKSGSSHTHNEASVNSGKSTKSKSKKSSKSNKTTVNSLSHFSGTKTSSTTASFNGTAHTSNANSGRLLHDFDTKSGLERKGSSSDEVAGKKVKSSKSKSHHKKHKHSEKNNSAHGSSKSDSAGEKSRSKSKHSTHQQPSAFTSTMLAYSRSSALPTLVPSSSSSLSVGNNLESGFRQSGSPKLDSFVKSNSLLQAQKRSQLTEHVRTSAALTASTADNGSNFIQACNDKDSHNGESSHASSNHGRKKHRKGPTTFSLMSNSGITIKIRESADIAQQKAIGNGGQHCNGGKRDRSSCNPNSTVAGDDISAMKKAKLDAGRKSAASPRTSSSNAESNLRPVPQRNNNNGAENNKSVSATRKPQSPKHRSLIDIGESGQVSAGNISSDCGAIPVPPPVFAPSSLFAQSVPRYSGPGHGEYANSLVTSSETSSVWSSASSSHKTDISRSSANTGSPIVNSHRSVGTVTSTTDIGVMTEPDALGPCEPGTSVHLDGIVWHETDTGMLVVNVTWRNRTYVGTLLDATKHDWAPPRFSDNDLEMELRGKSGRPKRSRGGGGVAEATRKGRSRVGVQSVTDDIKGSPSAAAKRRNKNSESETATNTDNDGSSTPRSSKRARLATSRVAKDMTQQVQILQNDRSTNGSNGGSSPSPCSSPIFIECPHPKCSKRYKNQNGLKYHQSHAHCDSNLKESGYLKEDDEISADQAHLCQEVETRFSDAEPGASPEKRGKERTGDESLKEHLCEDTSVLSTDEEVLKPTSKEMTGTLPPLDTSSVSKQNNSSLINEKQCNNTTNATTSNVLHLQTHSSSSLASTIPQTVAVSTNASASYDSTSKNFGHPIKSNYTTSSSMIYSEVPVSTVVRASTNRPMSCEVSAADNESAQAVETLLQLQGPDDQSLPGLSAPYSQDSPHPTLSLVSRGGQQSGQVNATNDLTPGIPANSLIERPPPATSDVKAASEYHVYASKTLQPPPSISSIKESVSKTATTTSFQSRDRFQEPMQLISSTIKPSKENGTSSVSAYIPHPQGAKMVKGKTVPIPVDPNHSLPLSYAGAASTSTLPPFNKKQKRKKKCDEKLEPPPQTERDSRFNEGANNYQVSLPQLQSQHPATTEFASVPPTPTTHSLTGAAATLNNMAVSLQNSQKPQNIALKANESSVLLTSSAAAAAAGHKLENDLRLPPQHYGGRKLPGVVLSAAANQNQFSNNVTVTGTFHPHPDPHKPQTAVSAQAQDRIRTDRAVSPANSNASSSNRNNNNKLADIQANTSTGRTQHQPEHPSIKPRSSVTQISPSHAEGTPSREQEGNSAPRPKFSDSGPWQAPPEHAMTKIQNNVENTIAHVYRDMATRGKDSVSTPPALHQLNEPVPSRSQPHPNEQRSTVARDDLASQRIVSTPPQRGRTLQEATIEVRDASPNTQVKPPMGEPQLSAHHQTAYMSQFQQMYAAGSHPIFSMGGVGYIHPMEHPAYRVVAAQICADPRVKQQYEQYMQDVQKHTYLQQQQLLAHQQQGDKKIRKPEISSKDVPKQACSSNPVSQSPGEPDKTQPYLRQTPKRPSTGSPAPFQSQNTKEKSQIGGVLHSQHPRYKSPQPNSSVAMPDRCQSVVTTSPSASLSGSLHSRSDSLDRGRASTRDEGRLPMRKPSTPPARTEKSPEKIKDGNPPSSYRSPAVSPYHPVYQQAYDPSRSASFRNPQPYPIPPGFPPGFVYPSNPVPGASPMLQTHTRWPTSQLLNENQSPPAKDQPASRPRSPLRDDAGRGRLGVKPRELTSVQYGVKDRKPREVPSLSAQKLNGSPDPKMLVPTSVQQCRTSVGGPPSSIEHRPSSPPTQRHHHTHHHIHKGMIIPQYSYPASPVVAGSDAGYAASYPKRD